MSGLTEYQEFVNDMSASSAFSQWKKQNPKEYTTWQAFDKGVQNGSQPTPPVLKTKFGQGMVDAGIMYLHAWDSPDAPVPVPPPVTPPVEPPVTPPVEPPPVVTPPTPPSSATPFQKLSGERCHSAPSPAERASGCYELPSSRTSSVRPTRSAG